MRDAPRSGYRTRAPNFKTAPRYASSDRGCKTRCQDLPLILASSQVGRRLGSLIQALKIVDG